MNGLILSCLLHISYSVYYYCKSRCLSIHNLISFWFSFIVVMGWITVETDIYQAIHGTYVSFPYEPYILEFAFFYIFMWPFRSLNSDKFYLKDLFFFNADIKRFIQCLLVVFLLYLGVNAKNAFFVYQTSLVDAYYSVHNTGNLLFQLNEIEQKIIWICGSLFTWFSPLVIIYALYGLTNNRKRKSYSFYLLCIGICITCSFLSFISTGQRGAVFFFFVTFSILFIPLWKYLSKRIRRFFVTIIPLLVGVFFIYSVTMTVMRVEDSKTETPITTVLRYLGEPYPHLGNKFWNKVLVHPMGMRLYPFIIEPKQIISNSNSIGEQHIIWENITGVPILNYKTLYGDFYVEFGIWIPFIMVSLYSLLLWSFVKKSKVSVFAFPILYYYIEMAACAPLWFQKREWTGVRNLIAIIIIYFVLKLIFEKNNVVDEKSRHYNNI